jgi:putative hemin transport protein
MAMQTMQQASGPTASGGETLGARWAALRGSQPNLRIRDAARTLGVSEAELLATGCGKDVTRLSGDWREVLKQVPSFGRVMALTRNENCVHERKGVYGMPSFDGHIGLVLGDDIDLRIFVMNWAMGFAVRETMPKGERGSLHFFDAAGGALHKIYLQDEADSAAFDRVTAAFAAPDQSPLQAVDSLPEPTADLPDSAIDADRMRQRWANLKDTHEFFPLLRKYKVGRKQALRLGGAEFAVELKRSDARATLEAAAAQDLPIMVFVGNRGIIQIHTGKVKKLVAMGDWFNVLDPDFNLHLRESGIESVWLVRKPTSDGDVTSIEIFDAAGELLATLFGKRKPGQAEDPTWRKLAHSLAGDKLSPAWN